MKKYNLNVKFLDLDLDTKFLDLEDAKFYGK